MCSRGNGAAPGRGSGGQQGRPSVVAVGCNPAVECSGKPTPASPRPWSPCTATIAPLAPIPAPGCGLPSGKYWQDLLQPGSGGGASQAAGGLEQGHEGFVIAKTIVRLRRK